MVTIEKTKLTTAFLRYCQLVGDLQLGLGIMQLSTYSAHTA